MSLSEKLKIIQMDVENFKEISYCKPIEWN